MIITINQRCGMRLLLATLTICVLPGFSLHGLAGGVHPHGGHSESDHDDHGHGRDKPVLAYTHYTDKTELFVEFPPLVVNEPSTFIAHFTRMDNFKPITRGILDISLKQNGKTAARFRVKRPARKGIFLPDVTANNTGEYQLILEIRDGDLHATHDLGKVTVFKSKAAATIDQAEPEGDIGYLKEQQWDNPFAIVQAVERPLRSSVPGFATVTAPADGFAAVRAPSDGYFSTQKVVNTGEQVSMDQHLGTLVPRLGEGADIGNLLVAQERARSQLQLARADAERLKRLYKQGAIPEKHLEEAQQVFEVAKVEFQTAQSRLQQRAGKQGTAGIALHAPIAGEVVESSAYPGTFVRSGDVLFTLASRNKRWLNVQVPEKFAKDLHLSSGAWLLHGQKTVVLDRDNDAKVVKTSRQVDPSNRSVSLSIEYPTTHGPAVLGERLAAHVFTSESKILLAIPSSAIVDDGGQPVVYVQTGGETFARRNVSLGIRDGQWVEVLSGVAPNEWVVSEGAYYVKLASTGGDTIGHGHAH